MPLRKKDWNRRCYKSTNSYRVYRDLQIRHLIMAPLFFLCAGMLTQIWDLGERKELLVIWLFTPPFTVWEAHAVCV